MQIHILNTEELTPEGRTFIERRLSFALSRFAPKTRGIRVELAPTEGPMGSPATSCKITVRLRRSRDVCVTEVDGDWKTAIARAAERAGRAVSRSLERNRDFEQPRIHSIR